MLASRPFLTATWSNVVLLTYEAPDHLLCTHIPPGVELDRWNGKAHVSLVALEMRDVRVHRCRIPGFAAHPQVNFRIYARRGAAAAVVFVRELVPSRVIAAVGRWWYGEPFRTARIDARVDDRRDGLHVEYQFGPTAPRYRIAVAGAREAAVPPATSFEHHLKERTLGCGRDRLGRLRTFRVAHRRWAVHPVSAVEYDLDFATLYGKEWEPLNGSTPVSVIFAAGSDVAVFPPGRG